MAVQDERRAAFERARALRAGAAPKQRGSRRPYALLRTAIRTRIFGRGDQLVEPDLMVELATTRGAVREALSQLAIDGLVSRGPRAGTTVCDSFMAVDLGLQHYLDDRFDVVRVEEQVIPGSPVLRKLLGLESGSKVSMAEYVIRSQGHPYCIETCYWAPDVAPRTPFVNSPNDDLPSSFLRHFGTPLKRSATTVEAIHGDAETRAKLGATGDTPILLSEKVLYDANDVPREIQYIYYAAHKTYFRTSTDYRVAGEGGPQAAGGAHP